MKAPSTEQQVKALWEMKMAHLRMRWSYTNWDEAGQRMLEEDLKILKNNSNKG